MQDKEMTVIEHLSELRTRLILIIAPLIILAAYFYYISPSIIKFLLKPVIEFNLNLKFVGITDAFVTRIKLSCISAFLVLVPWTLYQIIKFVGPGLKKKERKVLFAGLASFSTALILGIVFGYFVLLPQILVFVVSYGKTYMAPAIIGSKYISFVALFSIIIGLIFTLPVIFICLGRLGLLSSGFLRKKRKFIIIAILAVEGLIIPTNDLFVFLYTALPVIAIYEISIWVVYIIERKRKKRGELYED